ncbi:MAG: hypothetical protein RIR18_1082 [Pseudomonadota bacterium]|jgi:hypothetical protein
MDCKCVGCDFYEGDHPEHGYVFCSRSGRKEMMNGSGCSQFSPDITASCHSSLGRCRNMDTSGDRDKCLLGLSEWCDAQQCNGYVARGYFS